MSLTEALEATSVRRMRALVEWLPPDAAVWADTSASWTVERELAAVQAELLGEVSRAVFAANGVRKSRWPKSVEVPRDLGRLDLDVAPDPTPTRFDPFRFTAWLAAVAPAAPAGGG